MGDLLTSFEGDYRASRTNHHHPSVPITERNTLEACSTGVFLDDRQLNHHQSAISRVKVDSNFRTDPTAYTMLHLVRLRKKQTNRWPILPSFPPGRGSKRWEYHTGGSSQDPSKKSNGMESVIWNPPLHRHESSPCPFERPQFGPCSLFPLRLLAAISTVLQRAVFGMIQTHFTDLESQPVMESHPGLYFQTLFIDSIMVTNSMLPILWPSPMMPLVSQLSSR